MNFKNKKILVVGLGVSGLAAVRFFLRKKAQVAATDRRGRGEIRVPKGVEFHGGDHPPEIFLGRDLVLVSPGVPVDLPGLRLARRKRIPVLGEFGLAADFLKTPMIAVTGTNGKTTTVTLIAEILKKAGYRTALAGNVGKPLLEVVMEGRKLDWVVAEVSSYQLETVGYFRPFRPRVSVLLNVTDDHLDRYPSFNAYGKAKLRIFEGQGRRDAVIYNEEDPFLRRGVKKAKARKIPFSVKTQFADNSISYRYGKTTEKYPLNKVKLVGLHNVENMMAAIAATREAGVSQKIIQKTIEKFQGLPHRMEFVRERNGVRYYEDSKATNVDAVVKALAGFGDRQVVLIAGGRDKGGSYEPLWKMAGKKAKLVILMGESREVMGKSLPAHSPCSFEVEEVEGMKEAVALAGQRAQAGDAVLLSPACSSFDQFKDYKERGYVFQELVRGL